MKRVLLVLALIAGLIGLTPADAFWQSRDSNYNVSIVASGGTVTIDAQATPAIGVAGGQLSVTNTMTVGSGSNRAMVIWWRPGTALTDTLNVQWNVGGTLVGSPGAYTGFTGGTTQTLSSTPTTKSADNLLFMFGLVAPTPGSGTLLISWSTSYVVAIFLDMVSFTGVNQTGGSSSFVAATPATGTGAASALTITSATGDFPTDFVVNSASDGVGTPTQVPSGGVIYNPSNAAKAPGISYGTAATTAFAWVIQYAEPWDEIGVNIVHN